MPETPSIGSFGFTGELQQGRDVWLRARWYGAGRGGFGSRDPYVGDVQTPYSMMPYQYAYAAPTVWTDPGGQRVSPGEEGGSCGPGGKDASGHCHPTTTPTPEPVLRPVPPPLACGTGAQPPCVATPTPTPHAHPSPHNGALAGAGMVFITKPHPLSVAIGVCIIVLAYAAGQTVTRPNYTLPNDYVLPDEYVVPEPEPVTPAPAPVPIPVPTPDAEPNWVVRGGTATEDQLKRGTLEHIRVPGLYGFSVQHQPGQTIDQLASAGQFRNKQISVATAEALIAAAATAGYNIAIVKSPGRGYHHTVQTPYPLPDQLAAALSKAFTQMPNPQPYTGP